MYFGEDLDFEKALEKSIEASLKERRDKLCETWDPNVIKSPWGIKESVSKGKIKDIKDFFLHKTNSMLKLSNGDEVKILKGDVKEKEDEGILIFRYQLMME